MKRLERHGDFNLGRVHYDLLNQFPEWIQTVDGERVPLYSLSELTGAKGIELCVPDDAKEEEIDAVLATQIDPSVLEPSAQKEKEDLAQVNSILAKDEKDITQEDIQFSVAYLLGLAVKSDATPRWNPGA